MSVNHFEGLRNRTRQQYRPSWVDYAFDGLVTAIAAGALVAVGWVIGEMWRH